MTKHNPITGCLLGSAVGDSLGLPYEGMSGTRGARVFPDSSKHHFFLGKGMVSDDTEHACFVAQAVLRAKGDVQAFQRHLAWSLRWWLMGLPAGIGLATLRSILKLWLGFGPRHSGVFSAGNGPAMRGPILGVALGASPEMLKQYVWASTRLTHSDPKAYFGALAVALAAQHSASKPEIAGELYLKDLTALLYDEEAGEFMALMRKAVESAARDVPVQVFARTIGSSHGVSGYIYHTVPCVIQVWLRCHDDFGGAMREMIGAGGDTDTTAAILGGIIGARVGQEGIQPQMIAGILEWPRSIKWMERLGGAVSNCLEGKTVVRSPRYFWPGLAVRNLFFMAVVLAHGLRRLVPPY